MAASWKNRLQQLQPPPPGAFLAAYGLLVAGVGFATASLGIVGPLLLLAVPIPLLPLYYGRPVYLAALGILLGIGVPAIYTLEPDVLASWQRLGVELVSLIAITEIVRFVAAQRTRAVEALSTSEKSHQILLDASTVIPWEMDLPSWRFAYVGPQAERLLGYPLEAWYEEGFWPSHLHPDDRDWATSFCRAATDEGKNHEFEYRMLTADGKVVWLRDIVSVISGARGAEKLRGIMLDITAQRKASEERHRLEERMHQAQKLESLGMLTGGIAHDFNNLLMGVLGNAALAKSSLEPDSRTLVYLRDIEAAGRRAADLTDQMLAYAGKGRFELGVHDLSQLVREMAHLVEAATSKIAELSVDLGEQKVWIEADAAQVGQIVINLITNASEAIGSSAGVVRLRTGYRDVDRELLEGCVLRSSRLTSPCVFLEVTDSGPGMEAETLERIFDPFFTTKFHGRGLGLAAVLGIVRRHKGTIHVASTPGKGTAIQVMFPRAEAPVSIERDSEPDASDWRGSGTILVAEDEPLVLAIVTSAIESAGFQVLTACDGVEAIETFRACNERIDAVILDMTMPGASGIQVLEELRRIRPELPIVLASGYARQEFSLDDDLQGPQIFLHKPYRNEQLLAALCTLLDPENTASD